MAEEKTLKPKVIEEIAFPGLAQTSTSTGSNDTKETLSPSETPSLGLPTLNIATGLKSTSFDTETRMILGSFNFAQYGAIQIGRYVSGVSGDIKISPNGIIGRNSAGATTFSLNGLTGVLAISGYIQVGGAGADVNAGSTTIAPGKILISGSTTLANWASGGDATLIDGGKIYTGSITADKITAGQLVVGTNVGLGTAQTAGNVTTIIGNTVTTGYVNALGITANYVVANIAISSPSITGGDIYIGDSNNKVFMMASSGIGVLGFWGGGGLRGLLRGTTSATGGVHLVDGDFLLSNNRSFFITSSTAGGSEYAGIGVTSSNQFWLTLGTANTFYMKNNAQNDNYFTVSNDRAYHKNEFKANTFTSNSGDLNLNPNSGKVKCGSNLDLNEKNLDGGQTLWAYNFSNRSDSSLKKNVVTHTGNLDKIMQLRPVDYLLKDPTKAKKGNRRFIGLIAQELETVLPELVIEDENGSKGINYNELIPVLVGAIQELEKHIIATKG